jgi:sugar phosphate permease
MQIAINGFAFSYLVRTLELPPALAGTLLATAQTGGLIARIVLSAWARKATSTATALGWMGPCIAASIALLACLPTQPTTALPAPLIFTLMFVVGFLVSGWNGLLLAELARLAGPARTASWTGATMTVSYAGLVTAPLLFAFGGEHLRQTYFVLAALCAVNGIAVLLTRPPQSGAEA